MKIIKTDHRSFIAFFAILISISIILASFSPAAELLSDESGDFAAASESDTDSDAVSDSSDILILPATCVDEADEVFHWNFEYSDSYFYNDPSEYNHALARASLGLAMSSYRNLTDDAVSTDEWVIEYVTAAGFTDLSSEGYDQPTNEHTVSSLIAQKQMDGFTLIMAVPCGGKYGNEWLSNFNVGTGTRHEGFNEAAQMVEERILAYIEKYDITGEIKLWMAGYSRGAATANLVEADMTDTGLFSAVYGYNFAVPRNTKEKGSYSNIFNIVGKYDPVTMIPLAEWGYVRYGTDLFTPAQEMNSSYMQSKEDASIISLQVAEKPFRNNPGVNSQLHMILEYLLQIIPNNEEYVRSLQDSIKKAWVDHDIDSLWTIVEEALDNMKNIDAEQQAGVNNLITYIESVVTSHLRGNISEIEEGYWDNSESMVTNIVHEHGPEVYLEWMYSSDDPDDIFQNGDECRRILITGTVSCDVYDNSGIIESIDSDGNITHNNESGKNIYAVRQGSQTIITVPCDEIYEIHITAQKKESLGYLSTQYNDEELSGQTGALTGFSAEKGQTFILASDPDYEDLSLYASDGQEVEQWKSYLPYSPAVIMQLENVNVFHISLTSLLTIVIGVLSFLVLFVLFVIAIAVIHTVKCRKRGRPFSKYFVIIPHLLLVLLFFLISESVGYAMPAIKFLLPAFTVLASFITLLLAVRGSLRHKCKRNTMIMAALGICTAGSYFAAMYTWVGVVNLWQLIFMTLYYVAACAAAVYAFPHEGKIVKT